MGILKWNVQDKIKFDKFIFFKNSYTFWKHLIPFLLASLLLLILQVTKENLLMKLSTALKEPGAILIPAFILTIGSMVIYYYALKVQISKSYFWPDDDSKRAKWTSFFYIFLCTVVAYLLFILTQYPKSTFEGLLEYLRFIYDIWATLGNLWACLLLSVLSLTGIGWSGLGNWVDAMGIKNPDYTDGRKSAERITELIEGIRNDTNAGCVSESTCIEDFTKEIDALYKNIDDNLKLEPEWAKGNLLHVRNALSRLRTEIKTCPRFAEDDKHRNSNFINFFKGTLTVGGNLIGIMNELSQFSKSWASWGFRKD